MAAAIENVDRKGGGFDRWVQAIDQGSRGPFVGCYTCMLDGVRGEVSLSSKLGQWMQVISAVADGDSARACLLLGYLKASEISLSSPFGRWAMQMSSRFCAIVPPPA